MDPLLWTAQGIPLENLQAGHNMRGCQMVRGTKNLAANKVNNHHKLYNLGTITYL